MPNVQCTPCGLIIVTAGFVYLYTLGIKMVSPRRESIEDGGVGLYHQESLQAFEGRKGRVATVITDQRILPADIVI